MRLTKYSDYALRVLMYLASADRMCTIKEISENYAIPSNHLVKVTHQLASTDLIHSTRGKGGGIKLGKPAELINIGEVIRLTEQSFDVVECFSKDNDQCVLSSQCRLAKVLDDALQSFLAVLDGVTLADISTSKVKKLLNLVSK